MVDVLSLASRVVRLVAPVACTPKEVPLGCGNCLQPAARPAIPEFDREAEAGAALGDDCLGQAVAVEVAEVLDGARPGYSQRFQILDQIFFLGSG